MKGESVGKMGVISDKKKRNRQEPIFYLLDGTPVKYGDVLWHPDRCRAGWCCIAEFEPDTIDAKMVTVRAEGPNGAVPTVLISELCKEPPVLPKKDRDLLRDILFRDCVEAGLARIERKLANLEKTNAEANKALEASRAMVRAFREWQRVSDETTAQRFTARIAEAEKLLGIK